MKDSIRHYLQILAAGAALAMGASACGGDDNTGSGDDGGTAAATGTQFLQLAPYGSTRAAMNSTDTQFELAITVERQGKNASGQHKAALEPWDEAAPRSFNAEEGTSYQLLPQGLYAIEPQEVTLEEGEAGKAAVLKLDPSAVFEQVKQTGAQYALGVTLSSESAKIVSSRRSLAVVLDLNYPRLEFDMPQVAPSVSLRQEDTPVEIPTLFYYKVQGQEAGSPAAFSCKLAVPGNAAELVAEYNAKNNASYELLPEGSYDLGDGVSYQPGQQQAAATMTVHRAKLGVVSYLLPLTLAEPSDGSVLCSKEVYYISFGQTYSNPVIAKNCPDPTVMRAQDGKFYLYCTEGSGGNGGMGIYRSDNLVDWEHAGSVIQGNYLSWAELNNSKGGGDLWAPEARYINGKYYVYFSVSRMGMPEMSKIGVATGPTPTGPFTDSDKALISYDNEGDGSAMGVWNSIDQFYWEEDGKKYLFWGSFNGLFVTQLTDDGLSVLRDGEGEPVLDKQVAGSAFEATCIYKKNGYYYLLASVGSCCNGDNSTYRVVVGRSKDLLGPYVDKDGKKMIDNHYELVLDNNDRWVGPGHNSQILQDDAGQDWMIYHSYERGDTGKGRMLMLDRLLWTDDGWPYVRNAAPSDEETIPVFN